ncbi:MAG: TerD family protein [Chromatiales bacterium]|nr:TerD family protein [Chromatiales bacterium]
MKTLPKGANAPLSSAGRVRVELRWPPGRDTLDTVCFAVGADGRIPSDDWFVFYNQLQAPGGVVVLSTPAAGRAEIWVQPERLPASVDRLVIAAALSHGSFRDLIGARLTVTPASGEPIAFELTEAEDEQALIFAELYRHGAGWKLRAVGQGFRGGLQSLAEHFGVAVADERQAVPPPSDSASPASDSTPPRPMPLEAAASQESGRRQGRRRLGWLTWSLALLILLAAATGALWQFKPDWFALPGDLLAEARDRFAYTPNTNTTLDAPSLRHPRPPSATAAQ